MHDERCFVAENTDLPLIHLDAVRRDGRRIQQAERLQSLHDPFAEASLAVLDVGQCLRRMDMAADRQFRGGIRAAPQQNVIQRERRVQAEQSAPQAVSFGSAMQDIVSVFRDPLSGDLLAIPVRHFIAQAGPDSQRIGGLLHPEQAPRRTVGAGMMIKNRGNPVPDAVDHRNRRAVVNVLQCQRLIKTPPQPLQNFLELLRRLCLDVHSPGEAAVAVHMSVDQAWHNQPVACIQPFRPGVLISQFCRRRHGNNFMILDRHAAIFQDRRRRISRDHPSVTNQQHVVCLHSKSSAILSPTSFCLKSQAIFLQKLPHHEIGFINQTGAACQPVPGIAAQNGITVNPAKFFTEPRFKPFHQLLDHNIQRTLLGFLQCAAPSEQPQQAGASRQSAARFPLKTKSARQAIHRPDQIRIFLALLFQTHDQQHLGTVKSLQMQLRNSRQLVHPVSLP